MSRDNGGADCDRAHHDRANGCDEGPCDGLLTGHFLISLFSAVRLLLADEQCYSRVVPNAENCQKHGEPPWIGAGVGTIRHPALGNFTNPVAAASGTCAEGRDLIVQAIGKAETCLEKSQAR
ncbi:MAG: hypothetical protein H0W39_07875 [Sphingomonas sp.]|nr:hypothetical protein [Sphingomonas sp.]